MKRSSSIVNLGLLQTACSPNPDENLKKTLAFAERAAKQGANERYVGYLVERSDFDELPQDFESIVGRQDDAEPLEQLLAQLTEAVPLAGEPVLERRGPVDGQAPEKGAAEQCQ